MEGTKAFDDEQVRILLMGDGSQVEEALRIVDATLRRPLAARMRERLPGLLPDDLADAWQEALANVYEHIGNGCFDPNSPFFPWLWKIFHARSIDRLRRNKTWKALRERYEKRWAGTRVGDRMVRLAPDERDEVWRIIRETIAGLPHRQRLIFAVFIANLPESEEMDALRRLVSEASAREETLAAVKRALQEARQKAREALAQKGYTF